MKSLLFLSHRIPYPPDKGDKIRSYNVLKTLAKRFEIHLGSFVDLQEDWQRADELRGLVRSMELRPLPKYLAMIRSAHGLASGQPLSIRYYRDWQLRQWVHRTLDRHRIDGAYVFSSVMGQYLPPGRVPVSVIDFCDVDSDKWLQFARSRHWPMNWIYAREADLLSKEEYRLASRFDRVLLVSDAEARLFCSKAPDLATRVVIMRNGVDTEYFDPNRRYARTGLEGPLVVFTGAMDYWANVDAVSWFAAQVLPAVRQRVPSARFIIVGSQPEKSVINLGRLPGVEVTGTVADTRPYLAEAAVVVAPMRIARGLQNKVLEALAMARPVVATPSAVQGLHTACPPTVHVASDARDFASAVCNVLLEGRLSADSLAGRDFVRENYGWAAALQPLEGLLEGAGLEPAICQQRAEAVQARAHAGEATDS